MLRRMLELALEGAAGVNGQVATVIAIIGATPNSVAENLLSIQE
jgi:hypothetical protein